MKKSFVIVVMIASLLSACGNGGSGIIVIAYLTSSFSASAATAVSGGIITDFTSGSAVYRSHTFLSSSNLVIS